MTRHISPIEVNGNLAEDLSPKVYDELRRIAAKQMACWSPACTMQPTALVHEAWLRLGGAQETEWSSHPHFVAAAAQAMRHILVDRARRNRAVRHGGGQQRVSLEAIDVPTEEQDVETLLALNLVGVIKPMTARYQLVS